MLLALPYACGEVAVQPLFEDRLFVAMPDGDRGVVPMVMHAADIDESQLLLLEDGHCLKDHALAACNRPELRAEATMLGTSLHTIVQMVDNGLGHDDVAGDGGVGGDPRSYPDHGAAAVGGASRRARSRSPGAGRARARPISGCSPTLWWPPGRAERCGIETISPLDRIERNVHAAFAARRDT